MIKELHITNLAVIEDTTLEFTSKYTALIGTTGAGKSLIVNSLSLLNGERSDFSLVRDPTKKAVVSAIFTLSDEFLTKHPELKEYVVDHELIIKRSLNPDKSSRYLLQDEVVSLATFREVTRHLIDIHSQNGKNDLLDESKQILYVDLYGQKKIEPVLHRYQEAFKAYLKAKEQYEEFLSQSKELDRDYLSFQIAEIEKYDLQENEIEDLNEEYNSLRDFDKIKEKYLDFQSQTESNKGSLIDELNIALNRLNNFKETEFEALSNTMREHLYTLIDDLMTLDERFKALNKNPYRLDEINERLFQLKGLQRKYGKTTKEILDKYHDYKDKLNLIQSFEGEKERLNNEVLKKEQEATVLAEQLTQLREEASLQLAKAIGAEMTSLGLRKNAFRVDLTKGELTSLGQDQIRFMIAFNEGLQEASLAKAASGGESSRLMLALKVVLNALDPYDLLIFDEIDTGVSGQIASLVAKKIKSISKDSPLIVISHLPQVVASCDSGIMIEKKTKEKNTVTVAKPLTEKGIQEQVAKMLSGDEITSMALLQAKELIDEYHS